MTESEDVLDVLDRVRRFAPTPVSLSEWAPADDAQLLTRIVRDASADADVIPLHFVPATMARSSRWARMLPVAASAAVLATAAGVLIAMLPGGADDSPGGRLAGPVFDPPAGLSAQPDVGAHQFAYQVREQISLDSNGRPEPTSDFAMTMRDYVAPDGRIISRRTGQQKGCFTFAGRNHGTLDEPTRAFFLSLPTDVAALNRYLRSHVGGSSSHDEAVFVVVGDLLRDYDALASPKLRAAMVAVLSRTPGVTLHEGDRDFLGRAAVRADFVDQRIRPNEVQSLYFDATTFRYLEERSGTNGEPSRYAGPSPAYNGHGQTGVDPEQLSYPASIALVRSETVVDKARACP